MRRLSTSPSAPALSHTARALWCVVALSLCAAVIGCDKRSDSSTPAEQDSPLLQRRRAFVGQVGERVIYPRYVQLEAAAQALRVATEALTAAPADPTAWANARAAWRDAMNVWQALEVFLIGPAGMMSQTPGGEDLRDELYSWPVVNRCRVDQELVEGAYADPTAFAAEAVNVRGLDALEYLLFYEGTENACAPQAVINTDGSWAAIPAADLPQRRAQYAHTLSLDLITHAVTLRRRWDPADGGLVTAMQTVGQPDNPLFTSTQEALNALSDAAFYIEGEVKDMKLGRPAGVIDCDTATCPDALEHPYAKHSRDSILQNLLAFQDLFSPPPPALGFADLLRDVNASTLADTMSQDLAQAIALTQALPADLSDLLTSDLQSLLTLHAAIKRLSDNLKTEFLSVLDLDLPQRAEGDND